MGGPRLRTDRASYHLRRLYWSYARHGSQYRRDSLALQALTPLARTYVPWTHFALRPNAVVRVLNDIAVNRRTVVVECGGGVSTLFIARLLRERGGQLITIEESAEWAGSLDGQIRKERLAEHASIVHAPLGEVRLADGSHHLWYAPEPIAFLAARRDIDLLIVDGPVAERVPEIRYPALPWLWRSLVPGATVVLDDVDRLAEQRIVNRWRDELGVPFDVRFLSGLAVGTVPRR
jgi:predicted O-methyltransferase YrrM